MKYKVVLQRKDKFFALFLFMVKCYGGKLTEVKFPKGKTVSFKYNHLGSRTVKVVNGVETRYFVDGNKILAETYTPADRQADEYDKTVYHYGLDGLTGFTRRDVKYVYVYDCEGNVSMIYRPGEYGVLARYEYDAFGNCTVYDGNNQVNTQADFIGNVNPFRWKGHYYDVETGLYYIEGRYYDPAIGAYVDSSPISAVFDNFTVIGGLDRTGLLCNNVLELAVNPYTVSTTVTLNMEEPPLTDTPDTSQGIPWWHWLIGGVLAIGSFVIAAFTGGISVAITSALVGAGVGAAYGAFTAYSNKQNVGQGALIGAISGVIMANTALIGSKIAGASNAIALNRYLQGAIVSGIGGIASGTWSSIATQRLNYGKITNRSSIVISAISYGIVNVFSMFLGAVTEAYDHWLYEGIVNFFYDVITSIIGAVSDLLP